MASKISLKRESGSSILEPGIYRLKIEKIEEKDGPSGHPYLNIRYRVFGNNGPTHVAVWDVISLSPQARFKVDQWLDSVNAAEEGEASPRSFEGKFLWVSLGTGEFNGNVRNEVKTYLTEEVAQRQMDDNGDGGSEGEASSSKASAKKPASKGKKASANSTSELEEEDFPL